MSRLIDKKQAKQQIDEACRYAERHGDQMCAIWYVREDVPDGKPKLKLRYIYSTHLSSVRTNERINEIAHEFASGGQDYIDQQSTLSLATQAIERFEDVYKRGDTFDVADSFTTFHVWQALRDESCVPDRMDDTQIGRSFHRVCLSYAEMRDLDPSENEQRIMSDVKTGLNRLRKDGYDQAVVTWKGTIWDKDWFRRRMREENFLFLPRMKT